MFEFLFKGFKISYVIGTIETTPEIFCDSAKIEITPATVKVTLHMPNTIRTINAKTNKTKGINHPPTYFLEGGGIINFGSQDKVPELVKPLSPNRADRLMIVKFLSSCEEPAL